MYKHLYGKTVAVVGLGPSSDSCGEEIDKCDFVVRIKEWKTKSPNSGSKMNALVGHQGNHLECPKENEDQPWELWINIASNTVKEDPIGKCRNGVDWRGACNFANGRPIRFCPNSIQTQVNEEIQKISGDPGKCATAGIQAINMAIHFGATKIHIWGFDQMNSYNPNWFYSGSIVGLVADTVTHNFITEKKIIAEMVDFQTWCGIKLEHQTLIWHNRPALTFQPEITDDKFLIVIPARYDSTRLPGKPLTDICGKPMIVRTYENTVKQSGGSSVIVGTDDERVKKVCMDHNIPVVMTSPEHKTGTDRVWEVAQRTRAEYIINVQGDEPLMAPGVVDAIKQQVLYGHVFVCGCAELTEEEATKQSVGTLTVDKNNDALYITRSNIPNKYARETPLFTQVCIYGFTRESLAKFASWERGKLEQVEEIELLRVMENGCKLHMVLVPGERLAVDIPEDVDKVREAFRRKEDEEA